MNSKLLIGIAVVVIVAVGLVVLGGNKKQTPTSNPTVEQQPTTPPTQSQSTQKREDALVTVDSSGFSPSTLTIKAGTKVIWTNKSGKEISVNSDVHPTHRLYPPLNLVGEIPNGGTGKLVFDKPGTYKYHDHYSPSHTGTVVVE